MIEPEPAPRPSDKELVASVSFLADELEAFVAGIADSRRYWGERRDALKWVTAFSVAALFAVAQYVRGQAASEVRGLLISGALFLASIIAGVIFTAVLDLRLSGWLNQLSPRWSKDAAGVKAFAIAARNLEKAPTDSETETAARTDFDREFESLVERLQTSRSTYHVPPGLLSHDQSAIVANVCWSGFLLGLLAVVGDSLLRLRW